MPSPKGTTSKIALPKGSTTETPTKVSCRAASTNEPPKAAVNRGVYETVDGGDGDDGGQGPRGDPSTKPKSGAGYVKLGMTDKAPSPTEETDDDEDDSEKRRKERRRRALEEQLQATKQIRLVVILCSSLIIFLLVMAVIAAAIAYFILFSRGEPKKGPSIGDDKRVSYGYGKCAEAFKLEAPNDFRPKCITAKSLNPLENEKCGLVCTRHMFKLFDDVTHKGSPTPFSPKALPPQTKTFIEDLKSIVFCQGWHQRVNRPSLDSLNLCVSGVCNAKYTGPRKEKAYRYDEPSVATRGTWEDACDDHGHGCWESDADLDGGGFFFEHSVFDRDKCTSAVKCPSDGMTSAIVYLQQMECVMNPDGLGPFCKTDVSPPTMNPMFRLYVCKTCVNGKPSSTELEQQYRKACQDAGHQYDSTEATKCSVQCKTSNGTKRVILPDGAFCEQGDEMNYCVRGACFWWNTSLTINTIQEKTVCKEANNARNQRHAVFGDSTWGDDLQKT